MIDYDVMQRQVRREVWEWQEEHGPELGADDPKLSAKKGTITLEFYANALKREIFADIVDIINSYYAEIREISTFGRSDYRINVSAEHKLLSNDKKQTRIRLDYNAWRGGTIDTTGLVAFERSDAFGQEDVNCALAIWKLLAGKEINSTDPLAELESLGAKVYADNNEYFWDKLAGYEREKQDLVDTIILPFKNKDMYEKISMATKGRASTPVRAVLLRGPPGTGKTTASRIIANEMGCPLVYVPIEQVMSMWYGQSERRLSAMFNETAKLGSALLFIDEIDALAGGRSEQMHEATRRILSVLLRELAGIEKNSNVITLAATNRHQDLDDALLSRFNRQVEFALPSNTERAAIFSVYASQLSDDDSLQLGLKTNGKSGRDIEDICEDAERMWARRLIQGGKEASAPPLMVYLEAAGKMEKS